MSIQRGPHAATQQYIVSIHSFSADAVGLAINPRRQPRLSVLRTSTQHEMINDHSY